MSKLRSAGALALVAILALACSGGTPTAPPSEPPAASPAGFPGVAIEGVEWILKQQSSGSAMADVPAGTLATLLLDGGAASGSGGCNQFNSTYTLSGSSLTFAPLMTTKAACADPTSSVETAYFANLAKVASYTADATTLTLSDSSGTALLAYSSVPVPATIGSWIITGFYNGSAMTAPITGTFLTLLVGSDGTLTGSSGCNHYFGSYTLDGSTVKVSPLASTKAACPNSDIQNQETQFLAALQMAEGYTKDANGLTLTNTSKLSGGTVVTAVPAHTSDYVGSWQAVGINSGNGSLNPPAAGRPVTATFRASGQVEGSTGCNAFSGPYTVNGNSMSIGPLLSTSAACGSSLMETQQQQYLNALQNTATWSVDSGALMLRDATQDLMVQFQSATAPQ
jgi:putative lipoprotein